MELTIIEKSRGLELNQVFDAITANARSRNTQEAYRRDLLQFEAFADVSVDSLKGFLFYLGSNGCKWSTIQRKAAAVKTKYPELFTDDIKQYMLGLKRTIFDFDASRVIPKQAPPVSKKDLVRVSNQLLAMNTRKSLRDRVIIIIGWIACLRVSEIRNIRVCDLERTSTGYILHLRQSKNLKIGEVGRKYLPYSSNPAICPVRALETYLSTFDRLPPHYLFRGFRKGDHELLHQISKRAIQHLIPELFGDIYSSHSLRAGFITAAFQAGANTAQVMQQSGHKSVSSLMLYDRSDLTENNAVTQVI